MDGSGGLRALREARCCAQDAMRRCGVSGCVSVTARQAGVCVLVAAGSGDRAADVGWCPLLS
jgi:hypothetical protein